MAWGRLLISLILPQLVGLTAGAATARSIDDWYPALRKPSWNPPNWVFAPAWFVLYVAMGVALYRVWGLGWEQAGLALTLFGVQLVLNGLWSIVFFGLRSPGWALVEVIFLWLAVAATTVAMGRLDSLSWALLLPYLAWVTFAAALNGAVWWLNREPS